MEGLLILKLNQKISGKNKVRLINDITYRYKKNMYNIGFNIKDIENVV